MTWVSHNAKHLPFKYFSIGNKITERSGTYKKQELRNRFRSFRFCDSPSMLFKHPYAARSARFGSHPPMKRVPCLAMASRKVLTASYSDCRLSSAILCFFFRRLLIKSIIAAPKYITTQRSNDEKTRSQSPFYRNKTC